jgi:hypothetical protein
MFLRIIRKIFARHLTLHFIVPIIVGLIVESWIAWWRCTENCKPWIDYLFNLERLVLIVVAFAVYLVVMFVILWIETNKGMRRLGLGVLEEVLQDATGYFSVATIKLREWFEPSTQVYLATLLRRKLESPNFRHDRALLFFTKGKFKDLSSQYLDGYFAKAFIEIHKLHEIGLGYLEPNHVAEILESLSVEESKAIGYYPPKWPNALLKVAPLHRLRKRKRSRRLAFALVEQESGRRCVLSFSKHGERIGLKKIEDERTVACYEKVVNLIKKEVYVPGSFDHEIKASRDFTRFYL